MLSDCLGRSKYDHHKGMLPRPEFFNGQCAIVAVNVHLGYNQEDSLVMNRASLERGMFRSEHIRSYKAEVENSEAAGKKPKTDDLVSFGKMQSKIGRVDSLDDDGFPYIGANLQTGDIVIGKHAASGVDHSIKLKHTEKGMVQKVVLSANDEGKNFAVVSLRQVRSPCLGDKFSSMHGQKGVLGFLESQENFPFTKQGIVPDIVINPHAFPSRQTPGLDFREYERVYDGRTGEKVQSLIFMGPTFYQRLTHMAEDKVKFRNTGASSPSYSSACGRQETFRWNQVWKCKNMANVIQRPVFGGRKIRGPYCRFCESVEDVVRVNVPYGAKLLCQELFSMGISLKFDTELC
ncbi:UNVERIFIED_CONTAM: DNA-directed RNA polymerases IV and V subunit [Sesamum calycinum]|uniref:DNA-directed RNA polymerase n=1 Tax=Sesamum calycinum TaxID=2727403 RepID=A0AAW2QWH3_9LAMI